MHFGNVMAAKHRFKFNAAHSDIALPFSPLQYWFMLPLAVDKDDALLYSVLSHFLRF